MQIRCCNSGISYSTRLDGRSQFREMIGVPELVYLNMTGLTVMSVQVCAATAARTRLLL